MKVNTLCMNTGFSLTGYRSLTTDIGYFFNCGLTFVFSESDRISRIECENNVTLYGAHGSQSFGEIMDILGTVNTKVLSLSKNENFYYIQYVNSGLRYDFICPLGETGTNCSLVIH